jgi:outer membrane protein assembly factor BamB
MHRTRRSIAPRLLLAVFAGSGIFIATTTASAQQATLPAIADSPTAQTLFDDAVAQSKENPAESARLCRRLLDEYGDRLLKVAGEQDSLFRSVADETERLLLATPTVLERFRASESRAAEIMLAEDGAFSTASRRRLTRAGLVATLRVAQSLLLADRADEALVTVRRVSAHPDLRSAESKREAVGQAWITAVAAARTGLIAERDAALAQLESLAANEDAANDFGAAAALASAKATPTGSASNPALHPAANLTPTLATSLVRSPLEQGATGELPSADWQQVWSVELDRTLFRRLFDPSMMRTSPRLLDDARANATYMTAVPYVLGNVAYVNEGSYVRAIDIDSRDEIWSRTLGFGGVERDATNISDFSAIAVDRGALVTFEGHAASNRRAASSRVWCLDPANGSVRWNVDLDQIADREDLAGLFPVGTPLLLADTVVVAARKPTQRLEQVDWMIGLSRDDGSLRWATTIAGAPGGRGIYGRKQAGIRADGDAVAVSTPLGAIARVRASDGAILWLRRSLVPFAESRAANTPWEYAGPITAGDRIIAIAPDDASVVALDRMTGQLREERPIGPGTTWTTPRYLVSATLADGTPLVLAVGGDVAAFDARDLSKRLWTLSESLASAAKVEGEAPRAGAGNRQGIRGRVSVAGDRVLVPGLEEFLVLDAREGRVLSRIGQQTPGNAVMLGDRIVVAGDESFRVLMPPNRAEDILRARLAASPDDPAAAVALLELAKRTERWAVALEAARAAQSAIARGKGAPALRAELIGHLIELAQRQTDMGDSAFDIALAIADSVDLRVRVELARGEYLRTSGRTAEAADVWRRLASAADAQTTLVEQEGALRSVRIDTLRRLASIASRDTELSADLERRAAEALAVVRTADVTPESLIAMSIAHPRTQAALEAASEAAAAVADRRAATILAAVLDDCLIPPARSDLAEKLVQTFRERLQATPLATEAVLLERRVAELLVASGGGGPSGEKPGVVLPQLGAQRGSGVELRGRVAAYDGAAFEGRDPSLILAYVDGALARLGSEKLEPAWRLRLDDRDPRVLWAANRVAVYQRIPGGGENVTVIDPNDGTVLWSTPKAAALWMDDPNMVKTPERAPNGLPFVLSEVLPACDGENIVLARRDGRLARFGLRDERPDPVLAIAPLPRIFSTSLFQHRLVLGGQRQKSQSAEPSVAVMDPRSLEVLAEVQPTSGMPVRWAFATVLGEIFIGTDEGIERWTIDAMGTPRPALVTTNAFVGASSGPILLGANVLFRSANDIPTVLPLFEGDARPLEVAMNGAGNRVIRGIFPVAEGAVVHMTDRLLLVGPTGEVRGVDSSARGGTYNFAFPTKSSVALIEQAPLEPEREGLDMRGSGDACIVQQLSPKHGLRIEGEPFAFRMPGETVERALVADGWLLFSSKIALIAIPLPAPIPVRAEPVPAEEPAVGKLEPAVGLDGTNPPANATGDADTKRG